MQLRQTTLVAMLAVCGLALSAGFACADYAWPYVVDTTGDVLLGKPGTITASWAMNGSPSTAVDGLVLKFDGDVSGHDLTFVDDASGGEIRQVVYTGLNHNLNSVRLWSAIDVPPETVKIMGNSANTTDPLAAGWTTLLDTTSLVGAWSMDLPAEEPNVAMYKDLAIASLGTKSLLIEFTNPDNLGTGGANHMRISEIQAYGVAVPEPSAILLMAMGLFGMLAYAWRKR